MIILLKIGSNLTIIIKNKSTFDSFKYIYKQVNSIFFTGTCFNEVNFINKLYKNIQKSTAILFNIRNSLSSIRLNITINNIHIECNSNIQFWGY